MRHGLLLLLLLLSPLTLASCGADERRPDVILIVVDTLRADAVQGDAIETPWIDALATDGIAFTRAFSHAPMTLPSHSSLFSSRAPFETGVLNNWQDVRQDLPLLAEWLQRFDYDTRAVVSLGTLNPKKQDLALDRGFAAFDADYWHVDRAPHVAARLRATLAAAEPDQPLFLFAHFSDPHEPYNAHGTADEGADVTLDGEALARVTTSDMTQLVRELELAAGEHVLELSGEDAFRIRSFQFFEPVEEGGWKKRPVVWEEGGMKTALTRARAVLTVETPGVHRLRVWVAESLKKPQAIARYALEVAFVDRYVGELLTELRALGRYENSLIVFTSDHGEALGERNVIGHVQNLHDEMLHVPLIVKLPRGDPRVGILVRAQESLVPHVDLVPTILDLVGLPALPGQRGRSLLAGGSELLIAQTHRPESKRDFVCLRDARYKMILAPADGRYEMYDLVADPGELQDVFVEQRSRREEWVAQLALIAEVAAAAMLEGSLDPAVLEALEALGYF